MIKTAKYFQKKVVKPTVDRIAVKEVRRKAAILRLKTDYDKKVDSVELYEDYKDEMPFVDDRNQVLNLIFCCTCELNRVCSGYCYVPRAQPGILSRSPGRNC